MMDTPEERHQARVFQYVNWTTAVILSIVVAVFFIPVPHGNDKYVDIGIGILLGILSSNSGTITGNPASNKKQDPTVNVTGNNPVVPVNPPTDIKP